MIHSEFYYYWYFKYTYFVRCLYRIIFYFKKPTVITARHPLSSNIKIVSENGEDLTKIYHFDSYNSRTKEAKIIHIIDKQLLSFDISFPGSYLALK